MQMARMKGVRQDGTGRHRKMSPLQQLRVPIQAVLRSAHAYPLNQAAATSAPTDA